MSERSFPLVSVVVPVLDGAGIIQRCIESLEAQKYQSLEIIIVDDGSTDGTPDLVQPPARLVKTRGRVGAGAARNLGAREAKGEILMFTDADCVVPPDWVSSALATIEREKVKCGGGGYAGTINQNFSQLFAFEELAYRRRNIHGYVNTLVSNNMFCDAGLFYQAGGFSENYRAASSEDFEFSWKISRSYQLWWDTENGVCHDFTDTLIDYLKQQFRFARDAVPMLLKNVALMKGRTHHGKQIYVETGLTIAALFSGLIQQWILTLILLGLIAVVNIGFLWRLQRRRGWLFMLRSVGVIYLRDFIIVGGVAWGMLKWAASLVTKPSTINPPSPKGSGVASHQP